MKTRLASGFRFQVSGLTFRVSRDWLLALALFGAAFALYARTAAPGLLDGDEGEFQTNIARLGVSHTGYPLFFLLGKLWTMLVPVGTMAARANLFAAFWGALAVAALFVFTRWLVGTRWIALGVALLLTVSRVEWSQAIIPRPYTLNALFVILVTFFFFLWRTGKVDLTVPVFIFGLSLTNHRTMIWFAPAIAVLILWQERAALFQPRRLIALAGAFALPLLLYGYVFWRGDSDVGVEFHLKDFNEMILAGNASRWMYYGGLDWIVHRIRDVYLPLLIEQFTPLGFVVGLIGIGALVSNRVPRGWQSGLPARDAFVFIALTNIGNSAFCVFFNTIDVEKFFLPSYITFLFLMGVGIAVVGDWLGQGKRQKVEIKSRVIGEGCSVFARALLLAGLFASVGFLAVNNFSVNDWSGRTEVARAWDENLALPLEHNALIVGPWETLTPLEYAQYVEHRRTDLERWKVIVKQEQLKFTDYGSRQSDIERAVRAGRPVYFTVHPNETETLGALAEQFRLVRVGELWRIVNCEGREARGEGQGASCGAPVIKLGAIFRDHAGSGIELVSYAVYPSPNLRAGEFGLLMLSWRAPEAVSARLTISLRVVDAQDRVVYQRDAEPANGARPTIGWAPGEIVEDDAGFFVPADAAPGAYRLVIVVYDAGSGEEWVTLRGVQMDVAILWVVMVK
ncbi:MAG: DUF2723 domain-containing protein [Chloroflexi bacterium]|nr:DUF2723 domain-containing protein [Chloroflexota bacterium]